MNSKSLVLLALISILSVSLVFAQNTLDDVKLFQNFLRDAPIAKTLFVDGGLEYSSYDGFSDLVIGAQGAYPLNEKLHIDGALGFASRSYENDNIDGQSGLTDLYVGGRYNLMEDDTKVSAGGYVTLPIGEEKAGYGSLNFGAYGALRHPLDNGMVITGTLGLDFVEVTTKSFDFQTGETEEESDYENSLTLAGGVIYPVNDQLAAVGELMLRTEYDFMMLSGGADYTLEMGSKLRGALGIGLDDGAPDLMLMISFLHFFNQ
ncbi:hypothetical protein GF337_16760 [candidate division KSB1 bacterium]|nr:hypothetical protein [candidate division KSB1 bacterium]